MTATDPAGGVVALRTIGPVLIELPITVPPNHRPWAASIWPAPDHTGWGREVWAYDPARRGWTIPVSCTHGTVVEIGVATIPTRRRPALTHRAWYAVALAHDHHWLVCTTPFPGPADAHTHARQLTDRHRLAVTDRYRPSQPPT
jgi:hypothetical protein